MRSSPRSIPTGTTLVYSTYLGGNGKGDVIPGLTVTLSGTGLKFSSASSVTATPTTASTKYTGPITISASETLKFIAVLPGETSSAVRTVATTIQ